MAAKVAQIALHGTALWICIDAFSKLHTVSDISGVDIEDEYGGHYQFLTICGLSATTLVWVVSLARDLLPFVPGLSTIKNILGVAALPVSTLISLLYWSLLTVNPDLLTPPRQIADPDNPGQILFESVRLPLALDLALHALPATFLWLDFLLFSKPFPKSVRPALVSVAATVAYALWVEHCALQNGHFPYPLLTDLPQIGRVGVYLACSGTIYGILVLCQGVHRSVDQLLGREWDELAAKDGRTTGKGKVGKADKKRV